MPFVIPKEKKTNALLPKSQEQIQNENIFIIDDKRERMNQCIISKIDMMDGLLTNDRLILKYSGDFILVKNLIQFQISKIPLNESTK